MAFCEGRTGGDSGPIDLILKRSTDDGKTWKPLEVVWDDGENTCGNPCPVVDRQTGTIWLLMTWNLGTDHEREILSGKSKDVRHVYVTHFRGRRELLVDAKENQRNDAKGALALVRYRSRKWNTVEAWKTQRAIADNHVIIQITA